MNFFGHAAVASELSPDALFMLGAMLPDLTGMLRISGPDAQDAALAAGVRFHLATDAVFHACPTFVTLNVAGAGALRELGVSRGPARATAHLVTEMLLDSVLIANADYERHYLRALASARGDLDGLRWRRPQDAQNFAGLAAHLHERGALAHSSEPERIAFRVSRALGGRSRLAPTPAELEIITGWLPSQAAPLRERANGLMQELRAGLRTRASLGRLRQRSEQPDLLLGDKLS